MRKLTINETREISGGASKYVYCPICGYKYKTNWIERLLFPNWSVKNSLSEKHRGKRSSWAH